MATRLAHSASTLTIADALLRQIAAKIQLSPTSYGIAVDHYEAVDRFLARGASSLKSVYDGLYAQGSMAIGATIASRLKNDEFDIDVIAKLNIAPDVPPAAVLDALFEALNGEEGSIYHGKVKRNSRCVTIEYDRMHLDITPAVRLPDLAERTSTIFHAHEDDPPEKHRHIVANPWGFAQWFTAETPEVREIVEAVLRKSTDPVPEQEHVLEKSVSLIALQLLKRWRNKCYDNRPRSKRSPPSVVLAYFVALNSGQTRDLFTELRVQSNALYAEFAHAKHDRRLVAVHNPMCETDVLTDRWPGDLDNQAIFVRDLENLSAALDRVESEPTPEVCAKVFAELFGESVTKTVMEEFAKSYEVKASSGGLFSSGGTAGLSLAASGLAAAPTPARAQPIPRHTDFGGGD
jgi:hypothetical protein